MLPSRLHVRLGRFQGYGPVRPNPEAALRDIRGKPLVLVGRQPLSPDLSPQGGGAFREPEWELYRPLLVQAQQVLRIWVQHTWVETAPINLNHQLVGPHLKGGHYPSMHNTQFNTQDNYSGNSKNNKAAGSRVQRSKISRQQIGGVEPTLLSGRSGAVELVGGRVAVPRPAISCWVGVLAV